MPGHTYLKTGKTPGKLHEDAVWSLLAEGMNAYVGIHWEHLYRKAVSGSVPDGVTYGMASRWWGTAYDPEYASRLLAELQQKAALLPFARTSAVWAVP